MKKNNHSHQRESGEVNGWMIASIGLIVLTLGAGSLAIWAYFGYNEARTDVDGQISLAQAEARREQAEIEEAKFAEREKEPNRDFVGPDDYGRLTFKYPKTWSVYVARDISGGANYEAYLNPGVVPPVARDRQFATRVLIENTDYDRVLQNYTRQIDDGQLRSSSFTANGENGVRLDGNFSNDIRGSAVIFKVRDKTVTIRTDADVFLPDYNALIQTISFNR